MLRSAISAALIGAAVGSVLAGGVLFARAQTPAAAAVAVGIDNFTFNPPALTVKAGTTVTWTNKDEEPHTVVSSDGTTFHSPGMGTDATFSFTFQNAGTFAYICSIHPMMHGTVVVTK